MHIRKLLSLSVSAVLSVALFASVSAGQSSGPGVPNSELTFEVTNGNCLPQSVTTGAGRIAFVVKLSSNKPQHVALSTVGTTSMNLFEHEQVGSSERWQTVVSLPAGNYELISSLNGNKCMVTVS